MNLLINPFFTSDILYNDEYDDNNKTNNKKVTFASKVSVILIPKNNEYSDLDKLNMYYSGGDYIYFKKMFLYHKQQDELGSKFMEEIDFVEKTLRDSNTDLNKQNTDEINKDVIKLERKPSFFQTNNKLHIRSCNNSKKKFNNIHFNNFF